MSKTTNIFIVATITGFVGGAAAAQQQSVFDNPAEDRFEDIEESVEDDFERDLPQFGNEGRALGFSSQVSARATATSGNTDAVDIGIGTRLGYYDGVNGHLVTLSYIYGEDDGVKNVDSLFASYDYNRDLSDRLFLFGKVLAQRDGVAEDGAFENDAFIGFGAGYRVINTADVQWSVQAGPGYRIANLSDVDEITNTLTDFDEAALSLSSNYYNRISPTLVVTNDTDVLYSDSDTSVKNDLGLNVSMTNELALRTSLLTQYNSNVQGDAKNTDNTLGLSLVYTFN